MDRIELRRNVVNDKQLCVLILKDYVLWALVPSGPRQTLGKCTLESIEVVLSCEDQGNVDVLTNFYDTVSQVNRTRIATMFFCQLAQLGAERSICPPSYQKTGVTEVLGDGVCKREDFWSHQHAIQHAIQQKEKQER